MTTPQLSGWFQEAGQAWQEFARCYGEDPDLFFPGRHDAEQKYPIARRICAECVVRDNCREYALSRGENVGMWGGMTAHELRKERKRRLREAREG